MKYEMSVWVVAVKMVAVTLVAVKIMAVDPAARTRPGVVMPLTDSREMAYCRRFTSYSAEPVATMPSSSA